MSVHVNTLDAVPRRAHPHVGEEILEILPGLANANAPTAIVFIHAVLWIVTSRFHVRPGYVFSGLRLTVLETVGPFAANMAARACSITSKVAASDNYFLTAIALAAPHPLSAALPGAFDSNQIAKTLICDIYEGGHGSLHSRLQVSSGGGALERSVAAHYSGGCYGVEDRCYTQDHWLRAHFHERRTSAHCGAGACLERHMISPSPSCAFPV